MAADLERSSVRSKISTAGAFPGRDRSGVHRIKEQPLIADEGDWVWIFDPDPNSPVLGLGRREAPSPDEPTG